MKKIIELTSIIITLLRSCLERQTSNIYNLVFEILSKMYEKNSPKLRSKAPNLIRMIANTNPSSTKFFFPSIFEIWPKIDCYRLPTHRGGAHIIFFQ